MLSRAGLAPPATSEVEPAPGVRAPGAEPVWLTGGPWPLFAWVHRPAGGPGGGAVVLCPPLFAEHAAAYPLYRALAKSLAARGVAVVRFDYEGTGDSGGPTGGPGRVDAWIGCVDQAVRAARRFGHGALALVGIRSGALIAAAAAQHRLDVDAMLLWDPWTGGKPFLRRQQALQAMRFPLSVPAGDGAEVPGYTVEAQLAADLAALRLPPSLRARRAMVLVRPGQAPAPIPLAHLTGGSAAPTTAEVEETDAGEQEALFEVDPLVRRMPTVTTARAVAWLSLTLAKLSGTLPGGPGGPGATVATVAGATTGATIGATGYRVAVPAAAAGQAAVYERPVWLGSHRLFAVETQPHPGAGGFPLVVFLSSGADSHVGPSRLWVTLARRWAAEGARCLRVDLSGWGESAARSGRPDLVLRAPEAFDDVREIVAAAGAGPRQTVLVGLCSGAYQALESALDISPLGVLAVNPLLRFTPPELVEGLELSHHRQICDPRRPWTREVRARVPQPVRQAAVTVRRAVRRLGDASPGGSWLHRLEAAGVHVYCVCGEGELAQLPARQADADAPPPAESLVRVDLVPGLDHALLPAAQREEVAERLTVELRRIVDAAAGTPIATGAHGMAVARRTTPSDGERRR